MTIELDKIFRHTWQRLECDIQSKLISQMRTPDEVPETLWLFAQQKRPELEALADLAKLELALHRVQSADSEYPSASERICINPNLELIQVSWGPLLDVIAGANPIIQPMEQFLLLWKTKDSGQVRMDAATSADLLALKIISEQLDPITIANEQNQPVGNIDRTLTKAVAKGLLLSPQSKIRRDQRNSGLPGRGSDAFAMAKAFTLQWHITHRCDLHCKHCYDRSLQKDVDLDTGIDVLDQMREFCLRHHVYGQVSFSGGNPFMHPQFYQLYRAAGERNLNQAILGNPVDEKQLDELLAIEKPVFYQVSLEGLRDHNDRIRRDGNFDSVLDFLELLKRKRIYSMVMLTLTRDNMNQVLPLAEMLRGKVDLFTYNRLSMVGEGAALESPSATDYQEFVRSYLAASIQNPAMALKDNLINIERERQGDKLFGGCTGFGCGAAFNFFSLLPTGEVHACRKFPSPIGHIDHNNLTDIYYSESALKYRQGPLSCRGCHLNRVCRGCPAVTYGFGLDPLAETDPACFVDHCVFSR